MAPQRRGLNEGFDGFFIDTIDLIMYNLAFYVDNLCKISLKHT